MWPEKEEGGGSGGEDDTFSLLYPESAMLSELMVDSVGGHPSGTLAIVSGVPVKSILAGTTEYLTLAPPPPPPPHPTAATAAGAPPKKAADAAISSSSSSGGGSEEKGTGEGNDTEEPETGQEEQTSVQKKQQQPQPQSGGATKELRSLNLGHRNLGPFEVVLLCAALRRNGSSSSSNSSNSSNSNNSNNNNNNNNNGGGSGTVRSLDLSMNRACGVDKLGVGNWRGDGLAALTGLIARGHPSLRSASLYLNFLGPSAARILARCLRSPRKAKHFRVLNLQFTDVATDSDGPNKSSGGGGSSSNDGELSSSSSSSSSSSALLPHVVDALQNAAQFGGVKLAL